MSQTVKKWVAEFSIYENGEVVRRELACTGTNWSGGEKDIYFDTEEEAEEYIKDVDGEFVLGRALYIEVDESEGISYKDLKAKQAARLEELKLYLYDCPFCGKTPERVGKTAKCNTCNFSLSDKVWNKRVR